MPNYYPWNRLMFDAYKLDKGGKKIRVSFETGIVRCCTRVLYCCWHAYRCNVKSIDWIIQFPYIIVILHSLFNLRKPICVVVVWKYESNIMKLKRFLSIGLLLSVFRFLCKHYRCVIFLVKLHNTHILSVLGNKLFLI